MESFDFQKIVDLQKAGDWEGAGEVLAKAALGLERAGAKAILIATNTMHKVAPQVTKALSIPVLHIVDGVGERLKKDGINCIALLGTKFTMEDAFYKEHLEKKFQVKSLVPSEGDRDFIHNSIFAELCKGHVDDKSRDRFVEIIQTLKKSGAQAVILGCTEICLIICEKTSPLPVYDSTMIHCEMAEKFCLNL